MDKKDPVSKSWFAVFDNPADHGYPGTPEEICSKLRDEWIETSPTRTGAWVYCISDKGLHHVHMVLEDIKAMRFSAIKKSYAYGMHFNPTLGTKKEVESYINKTGKWEEKGEKIIYSVTYGEVVGNQGRRNDLNHLYDLVKSGLSDYEILEENPQYMKYLEKVSRVRETLRYEDFKNKRRTDLRVEYWWGPPGSGKTSGVLDLYGDANVYMVTDYSHPWDGYHGQDVVLFDDFDAQRIRTNDLLKWLDIYALELPCRFSNKVACYTKVYFTSNVSPEKLWRDELIWHTEIYDALMRRIHVVKRVDRPETDGYISLSASEYEQVKDLYGSI